MGSCSMRCSWRFGCQAIDLAHFLYDVREQHFPCCSVAGTKCTCRLYPSITATIDMGADSHAASGKEHVPPSSVDTDTGHKNTHCLEFATRAELPCAEANLHAVHYDQTLMISDNVYRGRRCDALSPTSAAGSHAVWYGQRRPTEMLRAVMCCCIS